MIERTDVAQGGGGDPVAEPFLNQCDQIVCGVNRREERICESSFVVLSDAKLEPCD